MAGRRRALIGLSHRQFTARDDYRSSSRNQEPARRL
jgi:hypothetical protein